jgi:hypothetical protein
MSYFLKLDWHFQKFTHNFKCFFYIIYNLNINIVVINLNLYINEYGIFIKLVYIL